jgi:hypothetical protein
MTFRRLRTFATIAMLMAWPSIIFACEGCKSSAQDGGAPNAIGQAFGLSIYFMLAVPMLIMAVMVRAIVRRCREMDQEHAHHFAPVSPVAPSREPENIAGLGTPIPVR